MIAVQQTLATKNINIGAFEAKTHFSELLRKVESGCIVKITRNGKEIAVMQNTSSVKNQKAINAWNNIINICDNSQNKNKLAISEIIDWRNNGRK